MFVLLNMGYSVKTAETISLLLSEAQSSFAPVEAARTCQTVFAPVNLSCCTSLLSSAFLA